MPPVHSKKPCSDCMFADGGKCEKHFSEGGAVGSGKNRRDHEKGVHLPPRGEKDKGVSYAGKSLREGDKETAKDFHKAVGREKRDFGMYAEGGDVDGNTLEDPMKPAGGESDDMSDMLVDELMDAFEKKDKQGVKDAIEALVMECLSKGDHDV